MVVSFPMALSRRYDFLLFLSRTAMACGLTHALRCFVALSRKIAGSARDFSSNPTGKSGEAALPAPGKSRFVLLPDQGLTSPAGGQFSSFMPSDKPREASTSLISLSDLRPRFGVLSSS